MPAQFALVAALRRQVERQEGLHRAEAASLSTGVRSLDQLLPWGGLRPGSLVEYLSAQESQGAGSLALAAARAACEEGRALVVVDRQRQFYPIAAASWRIDLAHTVVLRPATATEELWAVDQALRCPGVGGVWARLGALESRDFRHLQLAAECGGTLGLLLRPAQVARGPTWADVQWLVEPQPSREAWRLRVELVRCRGAAGGRSVVLELDEPTNHWREASHETHLVHPSSELADPAAARRQSRA